MNFVWYKFSEYAPYVADFGFPMFQVVRKLQSFNSKYVGDLLPVCTVRLSKPSVLTTGSNPLRHLEQPWMAMEMFLLKISHAQPKGNVESASVVLWQI